jgi:hypothetical protein
MLGADLQPAPEAPKLGVLGWTVGIAGILFMLHAALTDDTKGTLSSLNARRRRRFTRRR